MTRDCDRKIKTDSAKVTSARNMGLTMYDSLCLGTQKSTGIHCPKLTGVLRKYMSFSLGQTKLSA